LASNGNFWGSFNGNNHTLSNVFIRRSPAVTEIGIFKLVGTGGSVSNLVIEDVNILASNTVGGLVGAISEASISNVSITGTVIGAHGATGGLAGYSYGGIITDCSFDGSVYTNEIDLMNEGVGGLVGYADWSNIIDSHTSGNVGPVLGVGVHASNVGGLVGYILTDVNISNSYSLANINGLRAIGGLVGYNYYSGNSFAINSCYFSGDINAMDDMGGLVGYGGNISISGSYTSGNITGVDDGAGGLVGSAQENLFIYDSNSSTNISLHYAGFSSPYGEQAGGLIGNSDYAIIERSFASGDINAYGLVGGICGVCFGGSLSESFSTGSIYGLDTSIGGLVGRGRIDINNCYFDGNLIGYNPNVAVLAGIVSDQFASNITNTFFSGNAIETEGSSSSTAGIVYTQQSTDANIESSYWNQEILWASAGCNTISGICNTVGKTTAEMKQQATYTGWDFTSVWDICEDSSYPWLQWENRSC
jgi:hypothetical protein